MVNYDCTGTWVEKHCGLQWVRLMGMGAETQLRGNGHVNRNWIWDVGATFSTKTSFQQNTHEACIFGIYFFSSSSFFGLIFNFTDGKGNGNGNGHYCMHLQLYTRSNPLPPSLPFGLGKKHHHHHHHTLTFYNR